MAKNITDIGAAREQRVDGFNEFIFVPKGIFLTFNISATSDGPEPNANCVAADETTFVVRAKQMDQVTSPARPWIEFLCRSAHRWSRLPRPMWPIRLSVKRL